MKRALAACLMLLWLFAQTAALAIPLPKVGDEVIMGAYEQDNVTDNGKEPLEWIVLDVEDDRALLMTKYCIDTVIFYPERVPMYWAITDLRAWLNSEFIAETFSPEEQAEILTTTVQNANRHGIKGSGEDTQDKVYLLSKNEVLEYFPEQADRVAYPTEYAKSKGCTVDKKTGSCRWWTRSSGARPMDMCGMRLDGRISHYGMQDVDWPTNTMRPVMWVKCDTAPDAE